MNSFLKYGDIIALYCVDGGNHAMQEPDKSDEGRGNRHGFLGGLGFTDDGIYMQMQVKMPGEGLDNHETPRNYRRFLFELTPKLNCEAHDDYEKSLKYYKELLRNIGFMRREPEKYRTMKR